MNAAIIDETGAYRYLLAREWESATIGTALFIMLNPSTADAEKDDPTIRRCMGFAKMLNCNRLEVVNLFAMRSTDPKELVFCRFRDDPPDPIGPSNNVHILDASKRSSIIIAAWGSWRWPEVKQRAVDVTDLLRWSGKSVQCLKKTKSGDPAHPLYLPKNSRLEPFL